MNRWIVALGLVLCCATLYAAGTAEKAAPQSTIRLCSSTEELTAALASAQPGQQILLHGGVYRMDSPFDASAGRMAYFHAGADGLKTAPIVLRSLDIANPAILEGSGYVDPGYVLYITGNYWVIQNIGVRNGQKGVMIDNAEGTVLQGVTVSQIGQEGIHVRDGSTGTVADGVHISNTGLKDPGFGEGFYVGSDRSAWKLNQGDYDRKVSNTLLVNSVIGPGVTAELVDIKEGSSDTIIRDNLFLGGGISGVLFADSFIDNKGVRVTIEGNLAFREYNDVITADFTENNRTSTNPVCAAEETSDGDIKNSSDGNVFVNNVVYPGFRDPAIAAPAPRKAEAAPSAAGDDGVLSPVDDAFVRLGTPDIIKNESKVQVKQTHTLAAFEAASADERAAMDMRLGYLKFNLGGRDVAGISRVILRLNAQATGGGFIAIHGTKNATNAWTQEPDQSSSLTWNNQPGIGEFIARTEITAVGAYYEWDVTDYVRKFTDAEGFISFTVTDDEASGKYYAFYDMKNTKDTPQLVVK